MTVAGIVSLKDSLMVLAGQKKSDAVTYFPSKVPLLSYLNRHLFFPDPISSQVSNEKALEILNQEDYDLMISIDFQFPDIWSCLCGYLAKFYSLGGSINWSNFQEKSLFSPIILPNYPFQRDAYWYK
jgi:hypothetical protein